MTRNRRHWAPLFVVAHDAGTFRTRDAAEMRAFVAEHPEAHVTALLG